MGWLRRTLFHSIKLFGGFAIAQRLTRTQLRILCYHGFSVTDEHEVTPYVFMRVQTFERRMRILQKRGLPVITLDEAVSKLCAGTICRGETVITLDDGWASNMSIIPILQKYAYPSCIYITTEHLSTTAEAFNVILTHMVHRSTRRHVTLRNLHPKIDGEYDIDGNPASVAETLKAAASRIEPLAARQRLLPSLAAALGLDYAQFIEGGRFHLLSSSQIQQLARLGVSIQLHTHSHQLPSDNFNAVANEIQLNRAAIKKLTGVEAQHFCYPSGNYSPAHPEWLARLGVVSATTCDPGLNPRDASRYLLKRYLDSESTSDIEFEADITGVRELLRGVRYQFRRLLGLLRGFVRVLRRLG
jgi:peptidoglycan/xylan/chitin deacetylase (PgdA/CDA1 family)